MRKLIITEKPSVARDIANSLGHFQDKKEYLENENYLITWALGHLVTLAEPEDYDKKLKYWTLQSLPIIPAKFQLKVIPETAKRYQAIEKLLKKKEIEAVINACDAGREGELIFRYIYEKAECSKPTWRLWLSSMTSAAIKEGFEKLRPGEELELLGQAAKCRAASDWLVGINATRAFTRRLGTLLSIGRVQTPTLAILVRREREIQTFKPEKYFELFANFSAQEGSYKGKWFKKNRDRSLKKEELLEIASRLEGKTGQIIALDKRETKQIPPLLFDLTELQREANKRFGFTAKRTLNAAQNLYEQYKLITYPRTDCQYLGSDMIPQFKEILQAISVPPWKTYSSELLKLKSLPISKRIVDDSRLTDHHAIIPTPVRPDFELKSDEKKIYDLIVRRFLSVFYPEAIWQTVNLVTEVEGETFKTTARTLLNEGWLKVQEIPSSDHLPPVSLKEKVLTERTMVEEKETQPPPHFNEASLLLAMETAGKLLEDEELKEAMKERGLGTPATRATIIERLIEVGYLDREGKTLIPTPKGMELISIIESIPVNALSSPELTGDWEFKLLQIEKGQISPGKFMKEIEDFSREIVEEVKALNPQKVSAMRQAVHESIGTCPLCGGEVKENKVAYYCSNWKSGCKFTIWKKIAGKSISRRQAEELLRNGKTEIISGFRSKKGKRFRAWLELENGAVSLRFPNFRPDQIEEKKK